MSKRAPFTLLTALISLLPVGCASNNTTAVITVVDGCLLRIEGVQAQQASLIVKDWQFDGDCNLKIGTDIGQEDDG